MTTSSPCIVSKQSLMRSGYPQIQIDHQKYSQTRLVCTETHGLDYHDKTWVARHLCNNRACINPDHIIPGTPQENLWDRIEHGTNGRKLTVDQVRKIRVDARSYRRIARDYDVSYVLIGQIKRREAWAAA